MAKNHKDNLKKCFDVFLMLHKKPYLVENKDGQCLEFVREIKSRVNFNLFRSNCSIMRFLGEKYIHNCMY